MSKQIQAVVLAALASLLSACGLYGQKQEPIDDNIGKDPIVVRVSGYATYEDPRHATSQRHRLLAMRASKLDAYRALAERIYGTVIYGSSTVEALVMQNDGFKTMVDSVIRGARVMSVSELQGGGFETVLEVVLEARFRRCLTNVNYFRYTEECRMPLPHSDPDLRASMDSPAGAAGSSTGTGLYFLDGDVKK
ncbi:MULTISPECIES: LPP20 family lipoprotein [unclassified Hahella]|uniref:LPP20 family lipoprotein n=1 Tax=unclassified Hahella TaxID=2624107 RepID=UPI000FDD784A|nr:MULTISPECIES: LPP20 family lipoprotein [unclassified Hahella]AZZ94029.1 hypothetical protein ENC22_23655 [Hahella sp. KA22]MBU6953850.1 LPP20 family lipoprotein [Hahella sp. HN01]MDG9671406.1 LPP20 family lipoprotein [Hahella sp. CR1]QAY57403.1 hypothetical protein EUZ85_26240 [Hahella sp. KA22]